LPDFRLFCNCYGDILLVACRSPSINLQQGQGVNRWRPVGASGAPLARPAPGSLGGRSKFLLRSSATSAFAADAKFDDGFYGGMWHFVDRHFHTKIAGAKFPNENGSNRAAIIRRCESLELLVIQWDKGNRHDYCAKVVKRQSGEQLGFLPRGIAAEIHSDFSVPGVTWLGIFKQANHHPDTGQVVGAVILLARMTPEKRAQAEKKIAEAESAQPANPRVRRAKAASKPKPPDPSNPAATPSRGGEA
jgi:hypothetical protein